MNDGLPKPTPGDCATVMAGESAREVVLENNSFSTRHRVGYGRPDRAGRTLSAIQAFDRKCGLIRTSSGALVLTDGRAGVPRRCRARLGAAVTVSPVSR
jgi:hypothetical protein